MEMGNAFNNSELLELVEEEIEKVAGGKIDVKIGATRVLATALSALSLAGGVSTHAMESDRNSPFSFFTKKLEKGKKNNKSVVGKFTNPRDYQRMREFMCNHFNNFEIHKDKFWNKDVRNLIADNVHSFLNKVVKHPEDYKKLQSNLNEIFEGNYRFSKDILQRIANYVNECTRKHKSVTRANILLTIVKYYEFGIPHRNKVFAPKLNETFGQYMIYDDFPEDFLNLMQVKKEFSFEEVKRKIPYDSMLAYISDFGYMRTFFNHTEYFIKDSFLPLQKKAKKIISFGHSGAARESCIGFWNFAENLERARHTFYDYLDYTKLLLGSGILDLFYSFNNYHSHI